MRGFQKLIFRFGSLCSRSQKWHQIAFRFEDRLDGASNWKVRLTVLLEENDLWDIVKNVATPPTDL
jgi:hypothetical protein